MLGRLFQSATLVLLFGMLSLCAAAAPITVTDLENRTITLKETPQRIVVGNYILNFLMVGGAESLKKSSPCLRTAGRPRVLANTLR